MTLPSKPVDPQDPFQSSTEEARDTSNPSDVYPVDAVGVRSRTSGLRRDITKLKRKLNNSDENCAQEIKYLHPCKRNVYTDK